MNKAELTLEEQLELINKSVVNVCGDWNLDDLKWRNSCQYDIKLYDKYLLLKIADCYKINMCLEDSLNYGTLVNKIDECEIDYEYIYNYNVHDIVADFSFLIGDVEVHDQVLEHHILDCDNLLNNIFKYIDRYSPDGELYIKTMMNYLNDDYNKMIYKNYLIESKRNLLVFKNQLEIDLDKYLSKDCKKIENNNEPTL